MNNDLNMTVMKELKKSIITTEIEKQEINHVL